MDKYRSGWSVKKEHYDLGVLLDEEKKIEVLKDVFLRQVGYKLDLKNPQTFNQKIMWMKMYYQDPLICTCADKFALKEYAAETIGAEYVVPTIASWSDPDEIDFDALPDQFVLKVNWSSGYNIIVKDKSKLDIPAARKKLKKWMRPERSSYYQYFNWAYKHVKPVVYAEKFIAQLDGGLDDYKFHCFNGDPRVILIVTGRGTEGQIRTFVDQDWKVLPVRRDEYPQDPNPAKPESVEEMFRLSRTLSQKFPFVRVDFYEVDGRPYLGEMTFYPAGGLSPFNPPEWDLRFGQMLQLPEKLITDKEDGLKWKRAGKRFGMNVKKTLRKVRRKILRKEHYGKKKYLCVFGLRLPYETHMERGGGMCRKYIHIFGVEFCYKKFPVVNRKNGNINVKYKKVKPTEQGRLTRVDCEQLGYQKLGYFPNLKEPASLNEKLLWLAANDCDPKLALAGDRCAAKAWIAEQVGGEYVVPLLGRYDDVNDIPFDTLPEQFVISLNGRRDENRTITVRNKASLKADKIKAILSSWQYAETGEKTVYVVEPYIEAGNGQTPDHYRLYCCNGEPKLLQLDCVNELGRKTRALLDMEWNILPTANRGFLKGGEMDEPQCAAEMIRLGSKIAKDWTFVCVDFAEADGRLYIEGLEFAADTLIKFAARDWDLRLGRYLKLPVKTAAAVK